MHRKGFTIVELVVAVGLFAVIASIAVGGFANALRAQRQLTGLVGANSNVSLVIEQISREMRTGYDFCVNGQICPGLSEVSFRNSRQERVTYCLEGNAIWRGVGAGICGTGNFQKVTADNVTVRDLGFYLQGNLRGDGEQPRITIILGIASNQSGLEDNIVRLQTTVSPRLPLDS